MSRSSVVSRSRTVAVTLAVAVAAALLVGVAWQNANPSAGAKRALAAVGVRISVTVTGQKQGMFKGDDSSIAKTTGLINVTSYQFEGSSPFDPSTGVATGKAAFKPVVVTHLLGGSSPQFLDALGTNENLKSVVINFNRTDRRGMEVNYYRVTLTDAHVVDIKQYTSAADVLEDDALAWHKMEQQDLIAKTDIIITLGGGL